MKTRSVALGGVTAALAVVVMCLGGFVPLSTYICPVICCLILHFLALRLSTGMRWCWYGAVSLLVLLLGPDKEAAIVLLFLGNYPLIRTRLPSGIVGLLMKLVYFNSACFVMYFIMLHLLGIAAVVEEFARLDLVLTLVTLSLGNVMFVMLDKILKLLDRKYQNAK